MTDYLDPDHWVNWGDCNNSLPEAKAFAEVIKERDEARAEVDRINKQLEQAIAERTPHDYGTLKEEAQEMRKQRDETRAEVEQLKQALHDARLENSGQAALLERKQYIGKVTEMVRPEPSRLEIAAMAMQGLLVSSEYPKSVIVTDAVWCADKLIAAVKEGK
jgi:DNA repair exonuclease SbcCD ATPase subunit